MTMSSFVARLARDEDGGPLVEVAILLPILILFLFGGVASPRCPIPSLRV
jgi:Flp pilus assembly protein TadG